MSTTMTITPEQVVQCLLDLIAAVPEAADGLPPEAKTAAFWHDALNRNDRARRTLALLQELPAFTNLAPQDGDMAAWRNVVEKDFAGPATARTNTIATTIANLTKNLRRTLRQGKTPAGGHASSAGHQGGRRAGMCRGSWLQYAPRR